MTKTILVPIDFRVASLNTLKLALETSTEANVRVILLYAVHPEDSITGLLFHSPEKIINAVMSDEFKEALQILKNRFEGRMQTTGIELFHGYTKNALANFLEVHAIDQVYIPKTYTLELSQRGYDPIPLLRKSNIPVYEMEWISPRTRTEHEQLVALFT